MATNTVKNYLSLVKFSHTVFALPFALIGFFLAQKNCTNFTIDWMLFLKVLGCMVFARSAAMAFNRYLDRDIDQLNPRTKIREIPSGVISPKSAISFVIINCLAFILITYFINPICFYLSPVALTVVLGYSYTKRFTALCHLVLGLGLSLSPIGAYLAVCGEFKPIPVLFSVVVLFWVSGFDIIYALQDEEFDAGMKLNSIPVKLGKTGALKLSRVLHALSASAVCYIGVLLNPGILYMVATFFFIGALIYQHRLVKPNDLSRVNLAFFTTNGIASVVFGLLVIIDLFINR